MATLVLTAAGNAIGGPIGGAIGSFIGQQIDRSIFAPKGRDGPRLNELEVQTSSYGSDIPAIFGAMRIAGTVIWATDLIERRVKSGGGKGRPSMSGYSYSVNMAVALSSRPLLRVGRIWAEGNLLRGADGDFKTDTQFRLHKGHDDQPVDPLIASAETSGQCPAYRGIAYAVFEDFQLADYGNRIPSMTFEVFERNAEVPVNEIFAAAADGAIDASSNEMVTGYSMSGANGRTALSPLLDAMPIDIRAKGERLELLDWWQGADNALRAIPARSEQRIAFDRPTISQQPANAAPHALTLRHYDPARDYQSGVQTSWAAGAGRALQQLEIPAALSAGAAKRIAELRLQQTHRAKKSWSVDAVIGTALFCAGDWVRDASGEYWRITEVEHRLGTATISATSSIAFDPTLPKPASSGRNLSTPDLDAGQTRIVAIDLPVFGTVDPANPQFAIFASGTGPGWRRAALSVRDDDRLVEIGSTAQPATMGRTLNVVRPHPPGLIDFASKVEIQLLNEAMEIGSVNNLLSPGAGGLCWIEGEFVRFGSVEALGSGRHRLSNLLRGCYGSEQAIGGHVVGERFVLLDPDSARLIDDLPLIAGSFISVEAMGLADGEPIVSTTLITSNATLPLRPVHLSTQTLADGSIYLNWVRRSRIDFGWMDGVDQALVEDSEQYSIALLIDSQRAQQWTTASNELTIAIGELSRLGWSGDASITFEVRQIGRHMMSAPATIQIAVLL